MHNNNSHNRSNNNKSSAVRCDGVHPNCTRCLSTGVLCAYPSSRRSRNTQPTNVDPFIDNLSQLEARIRRIETDLESQRALVRTVCATDNNNTLQNNASVNTTVASRSTTNNALTTRILKTEKDLQESRSIVAQLRLRGEQRAARGRRAAAAAAASISTSSPGPDKNTVLSGKPNSKEAGTHPDKKRNKLRVNSNSNSAKKDNMTKSPYNNNTTTTSSMNDFGNAASPPFYFTQSNSSSPADFINPTPSYYFPYSPNHQYSTGTDMTPICGSSSSSSSSSAPFTIMVGDWPLLNDLPHNTTVHNNGFVDPMIIAAAEAHQHGIAPPLLSVSSYMGVDEENSIMAARAKSLSHLPQHNNMMAIPGLQPSSSSTSTCSNNSTNFANYNVYDTSYTNFMGSNTNDTIIMIDQQQNIR
ncbi:hypothetical protein INT48_000357 [Thamnidium elegans]|uniref:Zn(2)-C6 fungal-type domain-containing protein n=1 Tax=Thamnidium elegans TaxID=101142 RepID=A0A8H7SUY6_9FUNG|nr:hypothetical protein INT48_000357 [Thamnidium elegans]